MRNRNVEFSHRTEVDTDQDLVFTDVKSFHRLSPRGGGEIAEMGILPCVFPKRAESGLTSLPIHYMLYVVLLDILLALPWGNKKLRIMFFM